MDRAGLYLTLNDGLRLWHAGQPFPAHEAWEAAWHQTEGEEKTLSQALVQLAAARTKLERNEPVGTMKNLDKAVDRLRSLRSVSLLGLDLPELIGNIDAIPRGLDPVDDHSLRKLLPDRVDHTGVVYLHGFASSPTSTKAQRFRHALESRGWSVRVPDLNEPQFETLTVTRTLDRARRALFDRTLLIGSSMGGYIAALLAENDPRIQAQVLLAPAFGIADRLIHHLLPSGEASWKTHGFIEVEHHGYGESRPIHYAFVEDARTHPPEPKIHLPTYILAGAHDAVVPVQIIESIAKLSGANVTLNVTDDDHSLLETTDTAILAAQSLADRHLP